MLATTVEAPPPTVTPPAAAKSRGLKKVSFGTIAKKKEETKTAYPQFPDPDGKAAEIAARIKERTEQFESLEGALKTDKAELKFIVAPHYFKVNRGRHEVPSSIAVQSDKGEVLVTFQNRYTPLPDESVLHSILDEEQTEQFFRQSFEVKIKGDALPADQTQELMNEVQELFARYNCSDALEVKEGIKPNDDFHAARHVQLTPEVNLALEQVRPISATVKTKGRGK